MSNHIRRQTKFITASVIFLLVLVDFNSRLEDAFVMGEQKLTSDFYEIDEFNNIFQREDASTLFSNRSVRIVNEYIDEEEEYNNEYDYSNYEDYDYSHYEDYEYGEGSDYEDYTNDYEVSNEEQCFPDTDEYVNYDANEEDYNLMYNNLTYEVNSDKVHDDFSDTDNYVDYGDNREHYSVKFNSLTYDYFDVNDSEMEYQRLLEYHKRGYKWPIPNEFYTPNIPGRVNLMKHRFQQIERIQDRTERYEAYYNHVIESHLLSNFTEFGFGITRCMDKELMDELLQVLYDGVDTAPIEEGEPLNPSPLQPLFIDRPDLMEKVAIALQSYAETWAGIELLPFGAYGLRIYQNESELLMHIDRPQTHIIGISMHIASSNDSKPWPILIEDYYGNTHEVTLTSGDMLFYESSKLLHGRPKPFNGTWYCSVFIHYFPKHLSNYWNPDSNIRNEAHIAIPPIWWNEYNKDDDDDNNVDGDGDILPKVVIIESGFTEPDCPYKWCAVANTIQWNGPGENNIMITPTHQRLLFYPQLRQSSIIDDEGLHEEL